MSQGSGILDAKTITWGIILGALLPAVLYILSAFVSTGVMPWTEFSASEAPYAAVASSFMGPFGVLMARRKYPELVEKLPGFYKKKGFLVLPVIGLGVSVYLLILQGWKALLYAAVWMAVGLIIYFIGVGRDKKNIHALMEEWPSDRY